MTLEKSTTEKLHLSELKLSGDVLATLRREYGELSVNVIDNFLDLRGFDEEIIHRIIMDIDLHRRIPNLPLENLCSTFENYHPESDSQRELLTCAQKLADYDLKRNPAGIWVYGEPGLGKTHIGIGLMKKLMEKGVDSKFFQFPQIIPEKPHKYKAPGSSTFFLDEVNTLSNQGLAWVFEEVFLTTYNTNGRMYVTSNSIPEAVLNSGGYSLSKKSRYLSRIKNMFKIIEVKGDSNRKESAWLKD